MTKILKLDSCSDCPFFECDLWGPTCDITRKPLNPEHYNEWTGEYDREIPKHCPLDDAEEEK